MHRRLGSSTAGPSHVGTGLSVELRLRLPRLRRKGDGRALVEVCPELGLEATPALGGSAARIGGVGGGGHGEGGGGSGGGEVAAVVGRESSNGGSGAPEAGESNVLHEVDVTTNAMVSADTTTTDTTAGDDNDDDMDGPGRWDGRSEVQLAQGSVDGAALLLQVGVAYP